MFPVIFPHLPEAFTMVKSKLNSFRIYFKRTQLSSPPGAPLSHTEVQLCSRRAMLAPNSAKSGHLVYETYSPSLRTSSLSFPRSREMNSGRNPHWGPNTPPPPPPSDRYTLNLACLWLHTIHTSFVYLFVLPCFFVFYALCVFTASSILNMLMNIFLEFSFFFLLNLFSIFLSVSFQVLPVYISLLLLLFSTLLHSWKQSCSASAC